MKMRLLIPGIWGDQTWEEMMIGWYGTVRHLDPAARPSVASSSTGGAK